MEKVIVVEIGRITTTATLFNIIESKPAFGGQEVILTSQKTILSMMESIEKVLSQAGSYDPSQLKALYIMVTDPSEWDNDFTEFREGLRLTEGSRIITIADTNGAVMALGKLLLKEVGGFLIVDVGGGSVRIYSTYEAKGQAESPDINFTMESNLGIYDNAPKLVKGIGEEEIKSRFGSEWRELIKPVPETITEITFAAELTAQAVKEGLKIHFNKFKEKLNANWIIGTGRALVQLPNGMQALRDGLHEVINLGHPLALSDIPILIDRVGMIPAIGAIAQDFPEGSWELLLESLSVDS